MICSLRTNFIIIAIIKLAVVQAEPKIESGNIYESLRDHMMVTDKELFPYVVSIIKMASYLSAGAMISESWILTAADALFLVRESIRQLRVRIGSINYKKGGIVLPIKYFRIHPYFTDRTPLYDLALLKLSQPATRTHIIKPIKLRRGTKRSTPIHLIVTAWAHQEKNQVSNRKGKYASMESFKRNRQLMVRKMHSTDTKECRFEQEKLEIFDTDNLLCLDSNIGSDPCIRDGGAPVVVNGVLWGIVSSWTPEHCQSEPGPSFVNLVSTPNISSWIDAVIRDLHWKLKKIDSDEENFV